MSNKRDCPGVLAHHRKIGFGARHRAKRVTGPGEQGDLGGSADWRVPGWESQEMGPRCLGRGFHALPGG